jgi:vanillate/3-O-methylgallate O-demethylase
MAMTSRPESVGSLGNVYLQSRYIRLLAKTVIDYHQASDGSPHRPSQNFESVRVNAEDVLNVFRTQLNEGPTAMHIEMPVSATARLHYDKVLSKDGKQIGLAHYPGYTVNERAMMSLGSIEEAYAKPGTEVTLVWGEDGGGKRSAPWIEPHVQTSIRAIVAPSPISQAAQEYRTVLNAVRNAA